jgi:quinol-cytochrome oxidoreductase complex cytochrome b subunit
MDNKEFMNDCKAREMARKGARVLLATLSFLGFIILLVLSQLGVENDNQMVVVFVIIIIVLVVPFFVQDILYEKYKSQLSHQRTQDQE